MIVPTVVYGLATVDMGRADRKKLRDVTTGAVRSILGITSEMKGDDLWLCHEAGVDDPVDRLKTQELCAVAELCTKPGNMLAKEVITNDPDLGKKMENTMKKWNVTLSSLLAHRRSERSA